MRHRWQPDEDVGWQYSERKDGAKTRRKYLGPQHISGNNSCFSYSAIEKGLFCVPCVLFGARSAGEVSLQKLIRSALQNYNHLTGQDGYLTTQLSKRYYEDSCYKAKQFLQVASGGSIITYQQLNQVATAALEKSRLILRRILVAILFLGRFGLPLRGHRDSSLLSLTINEERFDYYAEGNFRVLLRLMSACGDSILQLHIETYSRNASFVS